MSFLMPRKRWFKTATISEYSDEETLPDVHERKESFKLPISQQCANYVQLLDVVSIVYSSFFLYLILHEDRYLFIHTTTFLLVPFVFFILEVIKFIGYQILRYKRINFSKTHFLNFVPTYLCSTLVFHVMFVLFGAEFFENVGATFMFSCYLATVTLTPLYFHRGTEAAFHVGFLENPDDYLHRSFWYVSVGAMTGAWFGAFVIPLDWNRPWQVWPIPNILGSMFGFVAGHLYSFFYLFKSRKGAVLRL